MTSPSARQSTARSARSILVFGGSGQVGRQLLVALAPLGSIVAPPRAMADLTKPDDLKALVERVQPAVVINAAALTNVDAAERDPALAHAVNEVAPGVIASAARDVGALMVHYSTDYVFDGASTTPYDETSMPNPINVYGASKLGGERRVAEAKGPHFIIRTSWVYSSTGAGFVASLLRDLGQKQALRIVSDQVGSPTWSRSLATATAKLIDRAMRDGEPVLSPQDSGVYHLGGSGEASRIEIANALIEAMDIRPAAITPVSAADFGAAAPRPAYSALANTRTAQRFGVFLDPWRVELRRMVVDAVR